MGDGIVHAAETEALHRVVDLIREMLDALQSVDADRQHIAFEFRWSIERLHADLRVRYRLAPAAADALLARTLTEAGRLVRSGGAAAFIGVA